MTTPPQRRAPGSAAAPSQQPVGPFGQFSAPAGPGGMWRGWRWLRIRSRWLWWTAGSSRTGAGFVARLLISLSFAPLQVPSLPTLDWAPTFCR